MVNEQIKLHNLSIFNFSYYEETFLNRIVICMILERPLHENE